MIRPFKIQIRFSDIDLMGHVNNAHYLTYFEAARIYYFTEILGPKVDWQTNGIILKKNEVEYMAPLFLHENAEIELFLAEIGTKSFTLEYELKVGDTIKTIGKSILVCYNFKENRTINISENLLSGLQTLKTK